MRTLRFWLTDEHKNEMISIDLKQLKAGIETQSAHSEVKLLS